MDVVRNVQLAREEEQREKKRAARRRQRANKAERNRAQREASVDSNWSRASGVTSVASTDTGRSNDLEVVGGIVLDGDEYDVVLDGDEYDDVHHGGGGKQRRRKERGVLDMFDAPYFQREDECKDARPGALRIAGAFFAQGGNYGALRTGLRNNAEVVVRQLHDLKSSPAHVLILNECPTDVVNFLRLDPRDATDECVIMNKKGEIRQFKKWLCVKPNETEWSNVIAVQCTHFGELKTLYWGKTVDGTYTSGGKPKKGRGRGGGAGGRGGGAGGRGGWDDDDDDEGPARADRKHCHSRILIAEAIAHPSQGFDYLGHNVIICNCHFHYKTAKQDQGLKEGYKKFFDLLAKKIEEHGVMLLYGDWNMSLFVVKSELADRGVDVDLCAWMLIAQPDGKPWFDTCAMFLLGGCQEPPTLLYGPKEEDDGGGKDGVEWIFNHSPPEGSNLLPNIREGDEEDDHEAEAAVAAGSSKGTKSGSRPLRGLPLKDGAQIYGFMPGTAKKGETNRRKYELNRAAMAAMFTTESLDDGLLPQWPLVEQKELDHTIYDEHKVLLQSGTHLPVAFVTKVPSRRSSHRTAGRAVERQHRMSQSNRKEQRDRIPIRVDRRDHAPSRPCRRDRTPTRPCPENIGARIMAGNWPPRQQAQQAIGTQAMNRDGTTISPMYVHSQMPNILQAAPMASPSSSSGAWSHGGGNPWFPSHGGGYPNAQPQDWNRYTNPDSAVFYPPQDTQPDSSSQGQTPMWFS